MFTAISAFTAYKTMIVNGLILVLFASTAAVSFNVGTKMKQGQWDASIVAKKEGEAAALKAAAEAIAKIEVKSETYIKPLVREIRTNTVYRECKHSPDSLRNLNSLITGSDAVDYGLVPAAKSAR